MLLRRYFWVLNLVIIALCALFLARGVSRLALAAYQPSASKSTHLPRMTHDNWLATPEIKQIVARNIFCSTCKPA